MERLFCAPSLRVRRCGLGKHLPVLHTPSLDLLPSCACSKQRTWFPDATWHLSSRTMEYF
ncbi:hypothetical protein JG688_00001631 [Phytophthora aleatoria]|uniref:Uncharacterized protein n=1 Tax=Phytophthora aleatoria TaxID=2496075 RepID=A0A8J5IYF0_9STRA|nr:hypothetical protein JG688_00001631 [Phytophthora aleatoria]